MATTSIPEKLYVTVQYRTDVADNDGGLLGFASPYTKDSAFEKRKSTQDTWAYGYGAQMEITDTDSVIIKSVPDNAKWDKTSLFVYKCQPRIIKNESIEGFEIAKSVRRYGWNGSGNVKWRITDPRGFDLEISSENFASVIDCVDMEKGLIKGKCTWGRDGSQNILLPESSIPYQEAITRTVKLNSKVSLKDVQLGDVVDVITTKVDAEDAIAIFYGKMYFLSVDHGTNDHGNFNGNFYLNKKQAESYLFKSVKSGKYFTINSSPKIASVVTKISTPEDKKILAKTVNEYIKDAGPTVGDIRNVILVSDIKIVPEKVEVEKSPVTGITEGAWPVIDSYYSRTYFAECNGKSYVTYMPNKWDRDRGEKLKLVEATMIPASHMIKQSQRYVEQRNSYYRYQVAEQDVLKDVDLSITTLYNIVIKYNGLESVVTVLR